MFHFMDGDQPWQDQDMSCGDRLVGRIMAAEYNLAVQRGDQQQANDALGKLLGMFLNRLFR
jgi:hypothetical protein